MDEKIEDFSYLWDGTEAGWVLLRVEPTAPPLIFNQVSKNALIVENEDLCNGIVQAMRASGVREIASVSD